MSTPAVNRLVDKHRKLVKLEVRVRLERRELDDAMRALSEDELIDYVRKTDAIDEAVEEGFNDADARDLAPSTARQYVVSAANRAGLDR